MAQRNTGAPELFNYDSRPYDNYNNARPSSRPGNFTQDPRYPVQANNLSQSSYGRNSGFNDYRDKVKHREYKYNMYSLIDEPWNRLCEVGSCGSFPANECVASRTPKFDWM